MRRLWMIMEYLPALTFLMIASFIASRFLIAFFPSEPIAWQLFLALAPLGQELGGLFPTSTLSNAVMALFGFFVSGATCFFLAQNQRFRRARFICFHLSLLALIFSMGDEKVWVASLNSSGRMIEYSIIPNFSALNPTIITLFIGVICICLATHRDLIWVIRHPVRRHRRPRQSGEIFYVKSDEKRCD